LFQSEHWCPWTTPSIGHELKILPSIRRFSQSNFLWIIIVTFINGVLVFYLYMIIRFYNRTIYHMAITSDVSDTDRKEMATEHFNFQKLDTV